MFRTTASLATTLLLLAPASCFFDFGRSAELAPGEIGAHAVVRPQDALEDAPFACLVPEGIGRVFRADEEGRVRARALQPGSWTLSFTHDRNGDGLPEWAADRAAQISVVAHAEGLFGTGEPRLTWIDLGDVELRGIVEVEGTVSREDGQTRVAGARVYAYRAAESLAAVIDEAGTVQEIEDALRGAEAVTTTDDDGAFRFPALTAGELSLAAFYDDAGERLATESKTLDTRPGERVSAGDLTSLRLVEPPAERGVQLELTPPVPRDVGLEVALVAPGATPTDADFADVGLSGGSGSFPFPAPVGVWDVYVRTSDGAEAFLPGQVSPVPGDELVVWGLATLWDDDPCRQDDGMLDCDTDGLQRLPPFDTSDDAAPERATWTACAAECGDAFGVDTTRSCTVGGEVYDCDDDGDDQPDVTEPQACYGIGKGRDSDGDGACDPADAFAQCAENDPAADACAAGRSDAFVPPPVRPEYGGPTVPVLDAGPTDAGVDAGPADAGFDAGGLDAGGVDAGAQDAGPDDAGFDAGPDDDAGFDAGPTDAGFDAGSGSVDAGPPVPIACDAPITLDDFDSAGDSAQGARISHSGDHVVAIWAERSGGTGYEGVAVARYRFSTDTWSTPFDVFAQTNPGFTPTYEVAVDADGDVTAIYRAVSGGNSTLYARQYDFVGDTWSAPEPLTPAVPSIGGYVVDYDRATGEPIVVYLTPTNSRSSVWFTTRGAGGWSAPELLESNDTDHIFNFSFAMNDVGQGVAAWSVDVGGTTPTHFTLPWNSGDWRRDGLTAPDPFSFTADSEFFSSLYPIAAIGDDGTAIVTVDDSFSTERELLAATVDIDGDTADAPVPVHTGMSPLTLGRAALAVNGAGHAAYVWKQREGFSGPEFPWATVYDGTSWSTPEQVGSSYDVATFGPSVDIDDNDVVTVAWASGFEGPVATRNTGPGGAFLADQQLTGNVSGSSRGGVATGDGGDFVMVYTESIDVRAVRCR